MNYEPMQFTKPVDYESSHQIHKQIMSGNGPEVVKTINFNTGRWYADNRQPMSAVLFADGSACFLDHARGIFGWVFKKVDFTKTGIMRVYDSPERQGWGGGFMDLRNLFTDIEIVEFDESTMFQF